MDAGHGDEEIIVVDGDIPGRTEGGGSRRTPRWHLSGLLTDAGDGADPAGGQIDAADGVVLVVGDVDGVAIDGDALRLVESGFSRRAVRKTGLGTADDQ